MIAYLPLNTGIQNMGYSHSDELTGVYWQWRQAWWEEDSLHGVWWETWETNDRWVFKPMWYPFSLLLTCIKDSRSCFSFSYSLLDQFKSQDIRVELLLRKFDKEMQFLH